MARPEISDFPEASPNPVDCALFVKLANLLCAGLVFA